MKVKELFEYVDEIMESQFSDEVKRVWLNQIEAEIQVDVLLLTPDGITQYDETLYEAELIAPPPFDQLYQEYLFWRICLAQQEFDLADGYAATFNRIYNEYVRFICSTMNPGDGMAERVQYYLTAYQIAVKHGYTGTELEWLASLKGDRGPDGPVGPQGPGIDDIQVKTDGTWVFLYEDGQIFEVKNEELYRAIYDAREAADRASLSADDASSAAKTALEAAEKIQQDKENGVFDGKDGKTGLPGFNIWSYAMVWLDPPSWDDYAQEMELNKAEFDEYWLPEGYEIKVGDIVIVDANPIYKVTADNGTVVTLTKTLVSIKGEQGQPGVGIERIEKTSGNGSPGTTDTYTIYLSDGNTHQFTVYNGKDGKDGEDSDVDLMGDPTAYYTPVVTQPNGTGSMVVSYEASQEEMPPVDPVEVTLPVGPPGEQGQTGPRGVSVTSVTAGANGSWTIQYSDGRTSTVQNTALTTAISNATNAANDASNQASKASSAASQANSAASAANSAASAAANAATKANNAATAALDEAGQASSAASAANRAADAANQAVEDLDDAALGKVDKTGWTPNKFLGTDSNGTVVEKDAPEGTGGSGTPGEDGGYYTPAVTQPNASTMRVSYTASKSGMAAVESKDITLPAGAKGDKGDPGYTPQKGVDYFDGDDGTSVTVSSVSESSVDGGSNVVKFSDGKSVTIKNGKTGGKGDKGDPGDAGADGTSVTVSDVSESAASGGTNIVTFSDGKKLNVKNGKDGKNGSDGSPGAPGADGKTPVKGTDYFTAADKTELVNSVLAALPTWTGGSY